MPIQRTESPIASSTCGERAWAVHAALLSVQVLFGMWPVAGAAAMRAVTPPAMIGFRTLLAAPLLFAIAWARGRKALPPARDLSALAGLAVLGVSANQLLYAEGLLRAGPVNAAVLSVLIPPLTLLVAMIAGRERPAASRIAGVFVALSGAALVLPLERLELSNATLCGDLLIVTNCLCYAAYLVFARPVVARIGADVAVAWVFLFGAIEALPFTLLPLVATEWSAFPAWLWATFAFIVLGPTVGAYGLNGWALRRADASLVAVYVCLQPVLGAFGAWLLLDTAITPRVVIAAAIIAIGVLISARPSHARALA